MATMHLIDRIEKALGSSKLDADDFERCAQDLLIEIFPGLSAVPGGTDWGRDADIHTAPGVTPMRLVATKSRRLSEVRANLRRSMESMRAHGVEGARLVLASPARLNNLQRNRLGQLARDHGATIEVIYDRTFFASRLRRDGDWRSKLLHIPGEPVSVARVPADLAESPWIDLPLVGRDEDVALLNDTNGEDVVLSAAPGTGKTRLLAEIDDIVFVDPDADLGRLADDLRWLQPSVVAIDDAGSRTSLIRGLRQLRAQEADLLSFRLVAACWPDEADTVGDAMPGARRHDLELLERTHLDALVRAAGITGLIVRGQILAQAEGRPGWAIALVDVLLARRSMTELFRGRALLGQMDRYLRRRQLSDRASDILTIIATIGHADESDLRRIADLLGIARAEVTALVRSNARSGLIDVQVEHTAEGRIRRFCVRPPMLAHALVADRLFQADVPPVELAEVIGSWPDRLVEIAREVMTAAVLGSDTARHAAPRLFARVIDDESLSFHQKMSVIDAYISVDDAAADAAMRAVRQGFDSTPTDVDGRTLEPFVRAAASVASRYAKPEAIELLFDAAMRDEWDTNRPGYPLQQLSDLVTRFHPELPAPVEQRMLIAKMAARWAESLSPGERDRWHVFGHAAEAALSLRRSGSQTEPGNPMSVSLWETIASADEIRHTATDVWPLLYKRLGPAPPATLRKVVEVIQGWLRVGAGYDKPFGKAHPQESIVAARDHGEGLLRDMTSLAQAHPGLSVLIADVGARYGIALEITTPDELAPFLADVKIVGNLQASAERFTANIADYVNGWAHEEPDVVCSRVRYISDQLDLVGRRIGWPPRIRTIFTVIAARTPDVRPWLPVALAEQLYPDAEPLLVRHIESGRRLPSDFLTEALEQPHARWSVMRTVLCEQMADPAEVLAVVHALRADDYGMLAGLAYESLPPGRAQALLRNADNAASAAFAIAIFDAHAHDEAWQLGDLEQDWLAALRGHAEVWSAPGVGRAVSSSSLFDNLASRYPDAFIEMVRTALAGEADSGFYQRLPHEAWEAMHLLPSDARRAMLKYYADRENLRWFLIGVMGGPDVTWLEEALDADEISADEAFAACSQFDNRPPIGDVARLLVPRGVTPDRIAGIEFSGGWTGDESARYDRIAERFSELVASPDASEAIVGRAGVEMFTAAAVEARRKERERRVRGYR